MDKPLLALIIGLFLVSSLLKDYFFLKQNKLLVWSVISHIIAFLGIVFYDSLGIFFEKYFPLALIIGLYLVWYSFVYFKKDKRNLKEKYAMLILWIAFILIVFFQLH